MKQLFTLMLVALMGTAYGQVTATFEELSVPADSFLNGDDLSGGFLSGNVFLPNSYSTQFQAWTGWAISTKTDTSTPGFMNQYSAITGTGFDSSATYALTYAFDPVILELRGDALGKPVGGFYITNSTYAYLSMRDGSSPPAKAFGGPTGDDPDFLSVSIKAYSAGELSADSVEFFLADYRFSDNNQDYIIDEWTFVDLSTLGNVDSLQFSIFSSDTGSFGINTPTYFCIDDVQTAGTATAIISDVSSPISLYPNPVRHSLLIGGLDSDFDLEVFDMNGRLILQRKDLRTSQSVRLDMLAPGTYVALIHSGRQSSRKIFVKQ